MGNGKRGKQTFIEKRIPLLPTLGARQDAFNIYFDWDVDDMGIPGAFYIKNYTQDEFFLVSVTLEDIPNHESIKFICNSWVYNAKQYDHDRIFFANQVIKLFSALFGYMVSNLIFCLLLIKHYYSKNLDHICLLRIKINFVEEIKIYTKFYIKFIFRIKTFKHRPLSTSVQIQI